MPSRLRIAHVVNNLALGGAERVVVNLAGAQVESGHEVHVYCIDGEGALAAEARKAGVIVEDLAKGPGLSAKTLAHLYNEIRRKKPDVLHTHNPSSHYYGAVAGFLARVPVIVNTRHSPVSSQAGHYREAYFRWLLPITSSVIFVSENARAAITSQWGRNGQSVHVIGNGVPVSRFRARPAHPGVARPRILFGTLGRLAPVKAHDVLVEAFRVVHDHAPHAELRIYGSGPLEAALKQQCAQLGLSDCVRVEPPTDDAAEVLSAFDVFVISSLSEGQPMVVLEAMAAGLPIVSTRVGGIPEVVPEGEVGWYCDPGNADSLAQAMLAAESSPDLARRGCAAAELAASRYDSSHRAGKYEEVYRAANNGTRQ